MFSIGQGQGQGVGSGTNMAFGNLIWKHSYLLVKFANEEFHEQVFWTFSHILD